MTDQCTFTSEQDAAIIRMREHQGLTFPSIAGEMECGKSGKQIRERYYLLAGAKGGARRRHYARQNAGEPLWMAEPRANDGHYVDKLVALGGFTRENFWNPSTGRPHESALISQDNRAVVHRLG